MHMVTMDALGIMPAHEQTLALETALESGTFTPLRRHVSIARTSSPCLLHVAHGERLSERAIALLESHRREHALPLLVSGDTPVVLHMSALHLQIPVSAPSRETDAQALAENDRVTLLSVDMSLSTSDVRELAAITNVRSAQWP